MGSLKRNFSNHIYHHDLISKNDKILLAVSGGIDSLVMAKLFSEFRDKSDFNIEIAAAHVDIEQISISQTQLTSLRQQLKKWDIEL